MPRWRGETRQTPRVLSLTQWPKVLNAPLSAVDPELYDIIEKEKNRQYKVCGSLASLELARLPTTKVLAAAVH